jgi:branched-chain amino acid transport system permease protein
MFDPYTETVLTNIGINIIMTLSMYFPLAVGQLSIAQVGFMAIGAHVATVLTLYLHVPFALAVLAAALVPWGMGLLLGWMVLRLQGLTLAFATFAFMEIVQVFFLNFTPTGDARGIKGIEPLTQLWHVWTIILVLLVFFWRLHRSRMGRAMAMVKHDEMVAAALGVDGRWVKVIAFATGALVAGVGGALYAHYALYIQYSDFGPDKALAILTYAVFGGVDMWLGGVLGAAVLSYLPVLLQVFDHWRLEIHGAIILVVMSLRPQGVLAADLCERLQVFWQCWRLPPAFPAYTETRQVQSPPVRKGS